MTPHEMNITILESLLTAETTRLRAHHLPDDVVGNCVHTARVVGLALLRRLRDEGWLVPEAPAEEKQSSP